MKVETIYGPPGTGKTKTLIDIANERAGHGPVLFLSYTKAAAQEAAGRVDDGALIEAGTIHSVAYRLRGLVRGSVIDRPKLVNFADLVGIPVKAREMDEELQIGDEYISVLAYAANRMISREEAYDRFDRPGRMDEFVAFADSYESWKKTYGLVDFQDMLHGAAHSLIPLAMSEIKKYKTLIIDEAQDCSPLQWLLIGRMAAAIGHVVIGGDDDQAIYEWSGADPGGMHRFSEANDADVRVLNKSYRVPHAIWTLATKEVAGQIVDRVNKEFRPTDKFGDVVHYGEMQDLPALSSLKQTMILGRDRWRVHEWKRALNQNMTPYATTDKSGPYENAMAHAIRALYKLSAGELPLLDAEWRSIIGCKPVAPWAERARNRDANAFKGCKWYDVIRVGDKLESFYDSADLFRPMEVVLSTIHQAKGRESENVILDLNLPARVLQQLYADWSAEARVMYVAVTRARRHLWLVGGNPVIE